MAKKKLIMVVAAVVVVLLVGGGAAFFLMGKKPAQTAEAAAEDEKKGEKGKEGEKKEEGGKEEGKKEGEGAKKAPAVNVNMGPTHSMTFVVNLADPGKPRFLKVNIDIESQNETVNAELEALKPRVRDAMITLLSSKSTTELVTVGDKERLKAEILHRLNSLSTSGKVVDVYFTEFMVQ